MIKYKLIERMMCMINVNEILKDGMYDLVADIVVGGVVFKDGVADGTYENGKMIGFEELLEIVNNNQVKRFLNLDMSDNEYGMAKIKVLLKAYLMGSGLKLDNSMTMRMFNIVKEIVNDMAVLSNKDEELLAGIRESEGIVCKDVMQYLLIVERNLIGE